MPDFKGCWTEDYYVGIMPDGSKRYFGTEADFKEELRSMQMDDEEWT